MDYEQFFRSFPGAVTVCDRNGVILEMNARAGETFASDGGRALLGSNVLDCHPEPARTKLRSMLGEGRTNVYTIEKNGLKKLIYQAPWLENGEYRGFLELAIIIPGDMPHFIREAKGDTA
ncbi:MAG: PAS domain-containing protein [Candidatus Aminicenantes bacterium]|nr:PAS domain-containing protein [Candidatus Aminicenantes bacterium]